MYCPVDARSRVFLLGLGFRTRRGVRDAGPGVVAMLAVGEWGLEVWISRAAGWVVLMVYY